MNQSRNMPLAIALTTLCMVVSACATQADVSRNTRGGASVAYVRDATFNPACAGGFRPSNNRSCDY